MCVWGGGEIERKREKRHYAKTEEACKKVIKAQEKALCGIHTRDLYDA